MVAILELGIVHIVQEQLLVITTSARCGPGLYDRVVCDRWVVVGKIVLKLNLCSTGTRY